MSARPEPPFESNDANEVAAHIQNNPRTWTEHIHALYGWISTVDQTLQQRQDQINNQDKRINRLTVTLELKEDEVTGLKNEICQLQERLMATMVQRDIATKERDSALATPPTTTHRLSLTPTRDQSSAAPAGTTSEATHETLGAPAIPPTTSTRLSGKLPDPRQFSGDRATLHHFTSQVRGKMEVNRDHFPTARHRVLYTISRLESSAYEILRPHIDNNLSTVHDFEDVLTILSNAYGDANEAETARLQLMNLRQKNKDFNTFFAEFQTLAMRGKAEGSILYTLLRRAVSDELRPTLRYGGVPKDDYSKLAEYLQEQENQIRAEQPLPSFRHYQSSKLPQHQLPRRELVASSAPAFHQASAKPPPPGATGDPMDLSNQRRLSRREGRLCFRCGSDQHFVSRCPKPDNRPVRPVQLRTVAATPPLPAIEHPAYERPSRQSSRPSSRSSMNSKNRSRLE